VAEGSAFVPELERVHAQARVDGAGGARALGALVHEVGQALREGAGLLEVLGRHPDLAVGADAMARALGEPPLHVVRGCRPERDPAQPETLDGLPINHSGTHVDFMIGSPDLTVTGVCRDGTRRDILDGERWVL
jgi:hypothetical protein